MTITIASATGVLTVPSSALQGADGDYAVMTLGADGTPQRQPVEVGLLTSTTAEITSGLAEGTAVVTGTASDLDRHRRPGQRPVRQRWHRDPRQRPGRRPDRNVVIEEDVKP